MPPIGLGGIRSSAARQAFKIVAAHSEIGSAHPLEKPLTMEVKGRNLMEGVPRTVRIDDSEIREALVQGCSPVPNRFFSRLAGKFAGNLHDFLKNFGTKSGDPAS